MAVKSEDGVAELEGQVTDLLKKVEDLTKQLGEANPDLEGLSELQAQTEEMAKALDDSIKARDAAVKELDTLKKQQEEDKQLQEIIAKASDEEKAAADEEKDPEKKKKWWLNLKKEERLQAIEKAKKEDETVQLDGRTIKKSAVGEDVFAILKGQSERIAATNEEIKKERDRREMSEFTKRADDDYKHVPGTAEERANVLRHVSKIEDKDLRKSFETILTQAEKLASGAFSKVGHSGGQGEVSDDIKKSKQDFETKVSEIKKRDSLSHSDAMSKARREHPDLFKAYQKVEGQAN